MIMASHILFLFTAGISKV